MIHAGGAFAECGDALSRRNFDKLYADMPGKRHGVTHLRTDCLINRHAEPPIPFLKDSALLAHKTGMLRRHATFVVSQNHLCHNAQISVSRTIVWRNCSVFPTATT